MLFHAVLAPEALDTAGRVDQTLGASVKRMARRTDLKVQLPDRRTSLEGVAARTGHDAATIVGMNSCFHWPTTTCGALYQRRGIHSIRGVSGGIAALILAIVSVCAPAFGAQTLELPPLVPAARQPEPTAARPAASPAVVIGAKPVGGAKPLAAGFAPTTTTLFAPLLQLVPAGPGRAARAVTLFDRQAGFYRRILFHPILSPELTTVTDLMPPRTATLLLAPSLYAQDDIPWRDGPQGAHSIDVSGAPSGANYLLGLAPPHPPPIQAEQLLSSFSLRPAVEEAGAKPSSVIGALGARLRLGAGYDPHSVVDLPAAILRQCYGDLQGPWDTAPGQFNQHDRAALARLRRDMPTLYARLQPYFRLSNVLDEFASASGSPLVLINFDAQIRPEAFARFPHFAAFYSRIAPRVDVTITVDNGAAGEWAQIRFDHGHLQVIFLDDAGMLRPFDSSLAPAGPALAPQAVMHGHYRVAMRLHYTRLRLTFGLDDLNFTTDYSRDRDGLHFVTRMPAAPTLVAPPIVQQVIRFLAERFMTTMASGHGGTIITLNSHAAGDDQMELAARWRAELSYSPALKLLARVADAIADAHNAAVREDERRIAEELFDALLHDYNVGKPRLLALDGPPPGAAH